MDGPMKLRHSPAQSLELAIEHHQAGRFSEAQALYSGVLKEDPVNADALHFLGLLMHQLGRHFEAIELIEKAHRNGRPHAVSLNNLGMAYAGAERLREAKKCFTKALALKPDYAVAHSNLGTALKNLGRTNEAERSYRRAVALEPDLAEAHYNLGTLLMELHNPQEAEVSYRRALALQPGHVKAQNNLGRALVQIGRLSEAEQCFRDALSIDRTCVEAHHNLGNVLKQLQRFEEAQCSYREAIALDAELVETRLNLGTVLQLSGKFEEAVQCYRDTLALKPDFGAAHFNLGNSLASLDRWQEAVASYEQATLLEPDLAAARWSLAVAQIPAVYDDVSDPRQRRAAFCDSLDKLKDWIVANPRVDGATMLAQQPFYLAYQEENNRDLLAKHGALCAVLMRRWLEKQRFPSVMRNSTGSIRLGIVSAHVRAHSVWHAVIKGWLQQLDRNRFELHVFHLGGKVDGETALAKSLATRFSEGPRSLRDWTEAILAEQLDVLAYPEIGMDAVTTQLASMRLAPMQLASWGHPQTTGLPTIDYYMSADGMEPPDAAEHYTEQLVRLPNLGCFYEPCSEAPVAPDLSALGIAEDCALLLCAGSPFKYLNRYDNVLIEIARRLQRSQFIFFTHTIPSFSEKLRIRLKQVFEQAGLDFDRNAIFIPWQPRAHFRGLMRRADVFLDTIGFSGFNTAVEAVECALPIVTSEGRYMRGRLASGILKRMNMPDLVVSSEAQYVDLAVKMACDAEYRRGIRDRLATSREMLYRDTAPTRALQDFLIAKVRR